MADDLLSTALAALDDCDAALAKLDRTCCLPERSPRVAALAEALRAVRERLDLVVADPETAEVTIAGLEDAGAQIGRLQVTCCAARRMPLYDRMLEGLNTVQRTVNKAAGTGH